MNRERIDYLYQQYRLGLLSEKEDEEWLAVFSDPAHESVLQEIADQEWDFAIVKNQESDPKRAGILYKKIVALPHPNRSESIRLWPSRMRITIAAASVIMVLAAGLFFYNLKVSPVNPELTTISQDVPPGIQSATLTLSDGKKIRLSDAVSGQLAQEAGISISKETDGQVVYTVMPAEAQKNDHYNTLSTANGETYQLQLPDGTKVWLNAASTLTYSTSFARLKQRWVKLAGEAYFEVAKDKAHPFLVETRLQTVKVLGTHFNVNAYADEAVSRTTLLEGKVSIAKTGYAAVVLTPGQQALSEGANMKILNADTQQAVAWKNGEFSLDETDFKTAMRQIERWYDVKVVYQDQIDEHLKTGGWISRNEKLSSVLQSIERAGTIRFKISGKIVAVYNR